MKLIMIVMICFAVFITNCSYDNKTVLENTLSILTALQTTYPETPCSYSCHYGSVSYENLHAYINNMLRSDDMLFKQPVVRGAIKKLLPCSHQTLLAILRYHEDQELSFNNTTVTLSSLANALDGMNEQHAEYKLNLMGEPAKLRNIQLQ